MYEHDYDGSMAKTGKRHLGKTRWTREEVQNQPFKMKCFTEMAPGDVASQEHGSI